MTTLEKLQANERDFQQQVTQLYRDHVAISGALRLVRDDVVHGRPIDLHDKLADESINQAHLLGRFDVLLESLRARTLRDVVARFEAFFRGLVIIWLTSPAGRDVLSERKVSVADILNASDLMSLQNSAVQLAADSRVADLMYSPPRRWIHFAHDHLAIRVAEPDRHALFELKATRNAIEHGGGLVNEHYIKALDGATARGRIGDTLSVDPLYLNRSVELIRRLATDLTTAALAKAG